MKSIILLLLATSFTLSAEAYSYGYCYDNEGNLRAGDASLGPANCTGIIIKTDAKITCMGVDGILRKGKATSPISCAGEVAYMKQSDAAEWYSCPFGTHLPTAREFAERSESFGAQGILKNVDGSSVTLEQVQNGSVNLPSDYNLIQAVNDNNKKDYFYFSFKGFRNPGGDLGKIFWSSSLVEYDSDQAYAFFGTDGYVGTWWRFHNEPKKAVLCVPNR